MSPATRSPDLAAHRPFPAVSATRDLTAIAITALVWSAEHRLGGRGGALSVCVSLAAGVMTAVAGFVVHEWGHLAGALLGGSAVRFPNRLRAPLLFHFDTRTNDRRQFLLMSYGGFAASGAVLVVLWLALPLERLSGRSAAVLAGIGTVVSVVAEVPTAVRVARGAPLPTGYAFTPPDPPGAT